MEDVLETYQKPRDPERPLVCLDETSKQLVIETRKPIPAKPGNRYGTITSTNATGWPTYSWTFAPLERAGAKSRSPTITPPPITRRCSKNYPTVHLPDAKQIVLVQDNLSTHTAASLYAAFPPEEARRLAKRFEWHYTPKHGSWLDMAESPNLPS